MNKTEAEKFLSEFLPILGSFTLEQGGGKYSCQYSPTGNNINGERYGCYSFADFAKWMTSRHDTISGMNIDELLRMSSLFGVPISLDELL